MATKTITMTVIEGNSTVTMRQTFDRDTTWMAIAFQFEKFLAAQGYRVELGEAGADVEAYVLATDNISDEEQW